MLLLPLVGLALHQFFVEIQRNAQMPQASRQTNLPGSSPAMMRVNKLGIISFLLACAAFEGIAYGRQDLIDGDLEVLWMAS